MSGSSRTTSDLAVQNLLHRLHDIPSKGVQKAEIESIYAYLQRSTAKKTRFHWFCRHAEPLTTESATYLLRSLVLAKSFHQVKIWKGWLNDCLGACAECVLGLEKAKASSRQSYFGAIPDDAMRVYWLVFSKWELDHILAQISSPSGWKNSSDIPTPVFYRMICNFKVFQNPRIQSFLEQTSLPRTPSNWPAASIPPAMLVLLMHANATLREWALNQVLRCTVVPISHDDASFLPYNQALELIMLSFSAQVRPETPIRLVADVETLWSSFHSVLRLLRPTHLTYSSSEGVDIRHVVTGHLHNDGPEFTTVLRCFNLILKRLGKNLWHGEGPEYPQLVFDAFKDNPSLITLLHENDLSSERDPWFFNWLPEYLFTIRDQPVYTEVVAKITDFMLQHERFSTARPIFLDSLSSSIWQLLKDQNLDGANSAISNVLDIHAEALVTVAFAHSHQKAEWKTAREVTRDLIHTTLMQDLRNINDTISRCTVVLALSLKKAEKDGSKPRIHDNGRDNMAPLAIREQIWKNIYVHVRPFDTEGIASVLSVLATTAHLDCILKSSFAPALHFPGLSVLLDSVNHSLEIIRSGFSELTSGYEMSMAASQVLQHSGTAKDIVKLMLSPVADLHGGAMGIVTQADDGGSDCRRECFQWLFDNFSEESFEGSFELLRVFNDYAPRIPEACNLSKSLVRCFTDIIGVLCSNYHGLLHQPDYNRPDGTGRRFEELWTLMCKTITVIFKQTPSWSQYYKSEVLTEWMRDALIFARGILGERAVFESAAIAATAAPKSSTISRRMLANLHEILAELSQWLRLTDEKLLHQSCTLIQSLLELFREKHHPLQQTVLQKLTKQVAGVRNRDYTSITCRLNPVKLASLEAILASFDDDDDDVATVEITKPVPMPKAPAKHTTQVKFEVKTKSSSDVSSRNLPASTSKMKLNHFSATDQERLDAANSMLKFRKPSTILKHALPSSLPYKPSTKASKSRGKEELSSDSEESVEKESQESLKAGSAKLQQSPKIRKKVERQQVKRVDKLPYLKQNAQEASFLKRDEAHQKALRFKPDISELHRTLLSWDYQHDGQFPPKAQWQLHSVPDTFSDFKHYRAVFEPLLLMECWAQLLQSKDDPPEYYYCKITSRSYNGHWLDLEVVFSSELRREWFLTGNDVVLLRHQEGKNTLLAKALSFRRPRNNPAEAGLRCYLPPDTRDPGLDLWSQWEISKVF
ncbi:SEN1 N terminal-domain-containing protein, partial [Lentinula detonsa]